MLDRTKLLTDVCRVSPHLFPDSSAIHALALQQWEKIKTDPTFQQRVDSAKSSFLVPGWRGNLHDTYKVSDGLSDYTVLAVDGSQVYPDRHVSGAGCFLLNTGGVVLQYGTTSSAQLFSNPRVMLPQEVVIDEKQGGFSVDLVDLEREALEFECANQHASTIAQEEPDMYKRLCFIDGSIIFWHLEGKQPDVKKKYLDIYLQLFDFFYHQQFLVAGYISFPKSKELINLIKLSLCRFAVADCIPCYSSFDTFPCKAVDSLIDTSLVKKFLPPGHRTTLFYSNSKITQSYPERLRPYFFYLDVGKEIARIEIPAWIADNATAVDRICAIALDQAEKGQGYPISLAEAHEQAVVKGPDREFFFHVLYKMGLEQNKPVVMSQKSIKKRGMGV